MGVCRTVGSVISNRDREREREGERQREEREGEREREERELVEVGDVEGRFVVRREAEMSQY